MKKETKALIPILVAITAMAALGQASYQTADQNKCNYRINIESGSVSSVDVGLNASKPQNFTVVWHYEDKRPVQSYFRAENEFSTDFELRDNRTLDRIEAVSMDCLDISDRYP